jgi:hypothetical protein
MRNFRQKIKKMEKKRKNTRKMWRPPPTRLGRPARNVMIVTPWADQGLGIQAREYAHQALAAGWGVFVWAQRPRKTATVDLAQVVNAEWTLPGVTVLDQDPEDWDACVQCCRQDHISDVLVLEHYA